MPRCLLVGCMMARAFSVVGGEVVNTALSLPLACLLAFQSITLTDREGGYLRVQNRSKHRIEFKVVEKNNVDDMGMDQIQGVMEPGSHLPKEGKQPFEDEDGNTDPDIVYCYIEGDVRNRMQRDGYMMLEAQVEGASPSGLKLTVDHDSWGMEDTSPDRDSPVKLVADVSEDEGMWKIELRVYDNYNTSRWMAVLQDSIKDLPLTRVGIPGTHDSGTYCFDKDKGASPDSDLTTTIQDKLPGRFLSNVILDQVFGRLCQCQEKSIKEQLEGGIRYLDLRVAVHAESGEYYVSFSHRQAVLIWKKTQNMFSHHHCFLQMRYPNRPVTESSAPTWSTS